MDDVAIEGCKETVKSVLSKLFVLQKLFKIHSGTVASSFWFSRFMAHQPEVCLSVLATVVITWEECGLASAPTPKLKLYYSFLSGLLAPFSLLLDG